MAILAPAAPTLATGSGASSVADSILKPGEAGKAGCFEVGGWDVFCCVVM
jgi:hypothetical protein